MHTLELGVVSLNVRHLKDQATFYQEVIGLDILTQTAETVTLGIEADQWPLLELNQGVELVPRDNTTGLYHLALLLPSREALSGKLRHFIEEKIAIGAADHGYSEALYLEDPEGNGIEIYADKPEASWDKRSNDQIKGVTLELKAAEILTLTEQAIVKMPTGTKMGHVHLSVASFAENEKFYREVLNFRLTDDLGGAARFFALDGYHHHIGTNTWRGTNLEKRQKTALGIQSFEMQWLTIESFNGVKNNLLAHKLMVEEITSNQFMTVDPNGIAIKMTLKK